MKRCTQCGREYDDSKQFCSSCGGRLAPVPAAPPPNPETGAGSGAKSGSGSWVEQWGGVLLSIAGLILEWEVSVFLGAAMVVVGLLWEIRASDNKASLIVSLLLFLAGLAMLAAWFWSWL